MERAVCEQCGEYQPGDWIPGHLCVACGGAVRREVRCAWCTKWVPASRFCRLCGCEVVGPEHYGPARMLKSAGVDRFSLGRRLGELDPEQVANLGRIYNAQLALVARRIDELRLCERYLLQRTFSRRVEEDLVARLPMEEDRLAALDAEPAEELADIAQRSPLAIARALASIALLRLGRFEETSTACDALRSDDPEVAQEAAAAFAHWRVRLCPYGIDERALRKVAAAVPRGSPLRPWAAIASVLVHHGDYGVVDPGMPEWVHEQLHAGLDARDPDLRFSCAMALGEDETVARVLDSSDQQQQLVARRFLARNHSPALAPLLREGSEGVRIEILEDLRPPLPDALIEPVLQALDRAPVGNRSQGVRLLQPTLTESTVERLIRIARRDRDVDMFQELLRSDPLPGGMKAVRAVIEAGLFEELDGPISRAKVLIDFTDQAVLRLVANGGPAVVENLVALARTQLDAVRWNDGTVLFLARILFTAPPEIRRQAFWVLDGAADACPQRNRDWLSPAARRELFGKPAAFVEAVLRLFEDEQIAPMAVGLLESHWGDTLPVLTEDRKLLKRSVEILGQLEVEKCRREAARVLAKLAVNFPDAALPAVAAMLRNNGREWDYRDVPGDLLADYDLLVRRIGRNRELVEELAAGLAALFPHGLGDERYLPAVELLTRLAQGHPYLRQSLAPSAPDIGERDYIKPHLNARLKVLAEALGFVPELKTAAPEECKTPPPEPPDDRVFLPDLPLKTLAEYVAFMQALNTAADPLAVIASHGMDQDSFVECITRWGAVLASNPELAVRYTEMMAG